jgi:hypothetical protein
MRPPWLWALLIALAGCPGEDAPPACVTVDTSCSPLYTPTFDNVYNSTLRTTCSGGLVACHAAGGAGKMSLADPATAHAQLLDGRVAPGDPGCSEIVARTDAPGKDYQMPPGIAMSAPERCSLIQWIAAGAPGPTSVAGGER